MAEPMTWLQTQVVKAEWDKINERRLKLNLKWAALLLPAVQSYLDQLESSQPTEQAEQPQAEETKPKAKKTKKE